jgi:hypothetical protein
MRDEVFTAKDVAAAVNVARGSGEHIDAYRPIAFIFGGEGGFLTHDLSWRGYVGFVAN